MTPHDSLLDHGQDNDGIQEYDNPLPQWFMLMFYGCVAFAFLYLGYYVGKTKGVMHATGLSQNLAYTGARYAALVRADEGARGSQPFLEPQGEALIAFLKSPGNISKGEALFKANCVACHGEQGQGVVGPNLTDRFWLHGGKPENLIASISNGWVEKGMPTWKPSLGEQKVHWLAAYVLSLRGKDVANPKAPQGVEERE